MEFTDKQAYIHHKKKEQIHITSLAFQSCQPFKRFIHYTEPEKLAIDDDEIDDLHFIYFFCGYSKRSRWNVPKAVGPSLQSSRAVAIVCF